MADQFYDKMYKVKGSKKMYVLFKKIYVEIKDASRL